MNRLIGGQCKGRKDFVVQIVILSFALCLSACGFQPMYASARDGGAGFGPVAVGYIDGKAGHVLRTELTRMLDVGAGAGGEPAQLEITLTEQHRRLGIRLDESATRAEYRLRANYSLTPAGGGRPVRGRLETTVNYELPLSAFGEITAQDDAVERAAETMARQFRAELAMRLAQAQRAAR